MESRVLAEADEVITITPFYVRRFEALAGRPVRLLTNGYDEADFKDMQPTRPEQFVIRHVGIVNEKCDPRPFMSALKEQMQDDQAFASDVKIEFVGEVHPDFRMFVTADPVLTKVTAFAGNIPHEKLIDRYATTSLLLLILTGYKDGEGFLPGKLFEYFATGLPILGVGPVDGDAGILLRETACGIMVDSNDSAGIKKALRSAYSGWVTKTQPYVNVGGVSRFSRQKITGQLVDIMQRRQADASGAQR
jgi:glycosyltransferase involved in cell wall biosynthesis